MTTEPTIDEFLRQWIKPEYMVEAQVLLSLTVQVFFEDERAGTPWARVKAADENLAEIESLANALRRKLASISTRGQWAILHHVNSANRPGTLAEWVKHLRATGDAVLLPMAELAKGARKSLPTPPRRGRPQKVTDNPLHALVREVADVHRKFGLPSDKNGAHVRENQTAAFVRELLEHLLVDVPDDLPRLIRRAAKKSPTI